MSTSVLIPLPKVGDDIYVPTELFLSHGRDDRRGGLAKVKKVEPGMSAGKTVHYVTTEEFPNLQHNWEGYLAEQQDRLKEEFGDQRAYCDPDDRKEFNEP